MRSARTSVNHRLIAFTLCAMAQACCTTPSVIHIGSPQERYDHNRTRLITSTAFGDTAPDSVRNGVYVAVPNSYPRVTYTPAEPPADGLAVANLVPVFPGVALPLSAKPSASSTSDRRDLIDYIATGPDAQLGVTPPDPEGMGGDTTATEARYKALLDVLQSSDMLGGDGVRLKDWASSHGIASTERVIDARYGGSTFAKHLALYCDHFWFVLFRPSTSDRFTRLVVVPVHTTGQDFDEKTPAGKDGRCG